MQAIPGNGESRILGGFAKCVNGPRRRWPNFFGDVLLRNRAHPEWLLLLQAVKIILGRA